jgi:hypothetical protein
MERHRIDSWVTFLLLLVCVGISSTLAQAQAINAPAGRTLFNRASLIRSFAEVRQLSVRTPDGKFVEVTQYIAPLAFVYGFYPKWTAIVVQPYVVADITTRAANQTTSQSLNGLADLQFFVQYDGFYSRNVPGGLTRLSGIFGIQAPTGAKRFSPDAYQYTGGLIFEKVAKLKYAFTADFQYTFATRNDQGLSVGDRAQFDAVPAYFIISQQEPPSDARWLRKAFHRVFQNGAYVMLEFNGNWQGHAQQLGTDLSNTGGTTLSISPGIQYFAGRRFVIEFSAPIPVVKNLNGGQPKPDSTFLFGFRWLF